MAPYRELEVLSDGEGADEEVVLVDEAGHARHLGGERPAVVLDVGVHHHLPRVPLRQGRHQGGLATAAAENQGRVLASGLHGTEMETDGREEVAWLGQRTGVTSARH